MDKVMRMLIVAALMLGLAASGDVFAQTAGSPEMTPQEVLQAIYDAINAGDLDMAMQYVADDAVLLLFPPPPGMSPVFAGKQAIRDWWQILIGSHGYVRLYDFAVFGDKVVVSNDTMEDMFAAIGTGPIAFDGVGIVSDGLLRSITWKFTDESLAKFEAAMAIAANKALAERFMQELWIEGNVAVADEILAADFVSHAFPPGDREALKGAVAGFHQDRPQGAFTVYEQVVTPDRIVLRGAAMDVPEGAAAGAQPEPFDEWIVMLAVENGQITDRWFAQVPE